MVSPAPPAFLGVSGRPSTEFTLTEHQSILAVTDIVTLTRGIEPNNFRRYKVVVEYLLQAGDGNRALDMHLNTTIDARQTRHMVNNAGTESVNRSAVLRIGNLDGRWAYAVIIIWVTPGRRIWGYMMSGNESDGATDFPISSRTMFDYVDTPIVNFTFRTDTNSESIDVGSQFTLYRSRF